jgi:hypothetical protein
VIPRGGRQSRTIVGVRVVPTRRRDAWGRPSRDATRPSVRDTSQALRMCMYPSQDTSTRVPIVPRSGRTVVLAGHTRRRRMRRRICGVPAVRLRRCLHPPRGEELLLLLSAHPRHSALHLRAVGLAEIHLHHGSACHQTMRMATGKAPPRRRCPPRRPLCRHPATPRPNKSPRSSSGACASLSMMRGTPNTQNEPQRPPVGRRSQFGKISLRAA